MKLFLVGSNNNAKISLDNPIEGLWKLLSFCFTNNIFNVNDNNNKIYINENGTDFTITLTNGYYDSNDLKTEISTQLNASLSGTVAVSLDSVNKFTITDTESFKFTFGSNTTGSARKLLGMNAEDDSSATSHTSDTPIDLNTHKHIFITITEDSDRDVVGTSHFSTSFIVNGEGTYGEIIRYNNRDNFDQFVKFRYTKSLKIRIHDLDNNDIDLNSDYTIILQKVK